MSNLIKKFNCSDILAIDDDLKCLKHIDALIDNGQYFNQVPGYQINVDIFKKDIKFWKKYRSSLIRSVKEYLQKEIELVDISSWAYVSTVDTNKCRNNLWHDHIFDEDGEIDQALPNKLSGNQKVVCGIYYLYVSDSDNLETAGTEFKINETTFFIKPEKNSWFLFEPELLHRSGVTNSKRYVLATDVIYEFSN